LYLGTWLKLFLVTTIISSAFTITFNQEIARFYIDNPKVAEVTATIVTIYGALLVPDVTVNSLSAFLRNLGEEDFIMRMFFIGYYGIALPLAGILGLGLDFSYYGVWGGLSLGCLTICVVVFKRFKDLDLEAVILRISKEV